MVPAPARVMTRMSIWVPQVMVQPPGRAGWSGVQQLMAWAAHRMASSRSEMVSAPGGGSSCSGWAGS